MTTLTPITAVIPSFTVTPVINTATFPNDIDVYNSEMPAVIAAQRLQGTQTNTLASQLNTLEANVESKEANAVAAANAAQVSADEVGTWSVASAFAVPTIADLATINTAIYTTAFVKDLNRGGTFVWSSTGTANGGTVFDGATGFWNRQYTGGVNVKWFGAVGDGLTDDTSAINTALAIGGIQLYFPKGTYNVTSTIWLKKHGQSIIGETLASNSFGYNSVNATIIKYVGTATPNPVVKIASDTLNGYSISGGRLENILINANSLADVCLYTPDVETYNFRNFKLIDSVTRAWDISGFDPTVAGINSFYNCTADNFTINVAGTSDGIYSGVTTASGAHPAFCKFSNFHITYLNGVGINLYEMDDCSFDTFGVSRSATGTGDSIIIQGDGAHGNSFTTYACNCADGTLPKIWAKTGSLANMFISAGIDGNNSPTIDDGAEAIVMYSGKNALANQGWARIASLSFNNNIASNPNSLNWYSESNFDSTLALVGQTTAGTGTYAVRSSHFTRIGNVVTFSLKMSWSAHTGTGNMLITGFPFSFKDATALSVSSAALVIGAGKQLSAKGIAGVDTVYLFADDVAGGSQSQLAMDTAGSIWVSGSYIVA